MIKFYFSFVLMVFSFSNELFAQNNLTLDELIITPSFEHVSIHQKILGDDNLNSQMIVSYSIAGAQDFKPAAIGRRAYPSLQVDGQDLNLNFHATSVMFLEPNSDYIIHLEFLDSDGGSMILNVPVTTKAFPIPSMTNIKFVAPGSGGGLGTLSNPYLGLQSAADNASPGDHFWVLPGTYSPFSINTNGIEGQPISFQSQINRSAIIDGNGTVSGIVTVGNSNDITKYIMLDGFVIQNGNWGIDAQNTQFLTVKNCFLQNINFGIYNRRENGWEHDQYIFNNELIGNTIWPASGIPGERGIDIRGNNHVVSYNSIRNFGDGISTDGAPYGVSYSLDIHNNDIKNIVDDFIEVDGTISNTRVYNNQGYNGRMGVSLAPILGGPCYVFRNQFFNMETSAFKMNRGPSGLIIVHNTSVKLENGMSSPSGWQNTYLRNNVIVGSRYCFEEFDLVIDSNDDWNFDGYLNSRDGTAGGPWFKYDNIRYNNVIDLQASGIIESNAYALDFSDFSNISLPVLYTTEYNSSDRNLEPTIGSNALNAGIGLDNLNLPYVTDGAPDLGAIESGSVPIHFGILPEASCTDGIKNGLETFVDCGGSQCTACVDCPYSTIEINARPIQKELSIQTSEWIKSGGTAPENGNIFLGSVQFIELLPGFEALKGVQFESRIEDCNN